MNVKITGLHLEVTEAIREYIHTKLERTTNHVDGVISTAVTLSVEKLKQKAEVDLHLAGKSIHVEAQSEDLYAAIDLVMDKLDRVLLKHKEIATDHRKTASGRELGMDVDAEA